MGQGLRGSQLKVQIFPPRLVQTPSALQVPLLFVKGQDVPPQNPSGVPQHFVHCVLLHTVQEVPWGYINKTFTPINFSVWLSKYSSLVGEEFNFPVNIKNSGLFSDIYNLTSWIEGDEFSARINPSTKSFFCRIAW